MRYGLYSKQKIEIQKYHFLNFKVILLVISGLCVACCYNISDLSGQTVIGTVKLDPESGNGVYPHSVVINPETNRVYVANIGNGNVSVVDGLTNELIKNIDIGSGNIDLTVNPITNLIYVTDIESDSVKVIDGLSNEVITTIDVGNSPTGIGVNFFSNMIYVANVSGNSVSVIDGLTNEVIDTVDVGSSPQTVGVNPVNNHIYVIDNNNFKNNISVIDGSTNVVIDTVELEDVILNGIGINPVTNFIYVTGFAANRSSDSLIVIDGITNNIVTTIEIDDSSASLLEIGVHSATNLIYVSRHDRVIVVDGTSNEIVSEIKVVDGNSFGRVAVNPVTNQIYVSNPFRNNLQVFAGSTNDIVTTVEIGGFPQALGANLVTNLIYAGDNTNNKISVIDGENNEVLTTIDTGNDPEKIGVNSVSNLIYVINSNSENIKVIDGVTNIIIDNISIGGCGIAVNSSTNRIYVADSKNESVNVIDGVTNMLINTIDVENDCDIVLNQVTNRIYVASAVGHSGIKDVSVVVIDGETDEIIAIVLLESKPDGFKTKLGVNPITNRIYAPGIGLNSPFSSTVFNNTIEVIDGFTYKVIEVIDMESNFNSHFGQIPGGIVVNPNTNHIFVVEDNVTDCICSVFDEGTDIVKVIDGLTSKIIVTFDLAPDEINLPRAITINPESNLIYVTNKLAGTIFVLMDEAIQIPTQTVTPTALSTPTATPTVMYPDTPTLTPTPTSTPQEQMLSSLIVNPGSSGNSLRLKEAIVTALDQNNLPMSDITITSSASGGNAIVSPGIAATVDGIAKFRFRFGFTSNDGKITFRADSLITNIIQTMKRGSSPD